jgi:hypothetical protein
MKTVTVINNWSEDAPINGLDLGKSARDIQVLHAKYLDLWRQAKHDMVISKIELKKLRAEKHDWLINPTKEHAARGWVYPDRKVLKGDHITYLQADEDLIQQELIVAECEASFEMMQDILKQIHNRNWIIKSAIEDRTFMSGG